MRPRAATTAVVIAIALVVGCSGGSDRSAPAFDAATRLESVKAVRGELEKAWDALDTVRDELQTLEDKQRLSSAEATRKTELEVEVKQAEQAFDSAYSADQSALADFLNEALNVQPKGAETLAALRLYADSAIRNAGDFIDHSGDYRRAVELLETARSYYDAVQAEVPQALVEAMEAARQLRFVARERFDQLRKGLSAAEVKSLIGVPFYANIRHSEVNGKQVTSWLYGREDGEVAAVYLDDRGVVYAWKWNVKE